jgi:hypothetical protein
MKVSPFQEIPGLHWVSEKKQLSCPTLPADALILPKPYLSDLKKFFARTGVSLHVSVFYVHVFFPDMSGFHAFECALIIIKMR